MNAVWDGGDVNNLLDNDSDRLRNDKEASCGRGYNENNATTYPDTADYGPEEWIPDAEDYCMREDASPYDAIQLWSNGSADSSDWADPGKQQ
jgi:hypothetical protein